MIKRHANPQTQKLFELAMRLRAKKASLHAVELAAHDYYPGNSPSILSMRSRLKRLFLSPPDDFAQATLRYEHGKNMHEIISVVPRISNRGASFGNVHGKGKRQKPLLPDLNKLWLIASEKDKRAFLAQHGLVLAQKH